MIIPLVLFWVLIFLGREELGFKGIIISVTVWLGLLLILPLKVHSAILLGHEGTGIWEVEQKVLV